jgi:protein phosphatase 1H
MNGHHQNGYEDSNKDDEFEVFATPFSYDHTPDTERSRLLTVGKLNPILMGGEYVAMEYAKKPMTKDLGTRILYRQGPMKGWTYKTLTREDLKMPIVTGEGKRSRLLGTIGVTRGFGDHDLKALGSGLPIKPFLSCHPDVIYRDLSKVESEPEDNNVDGEYGILVMATDGLWDVSDSDQVSRTVFNTLKKYPTEKHRYTMVAQELVAKSRGRANESGHWRLSDTKAAATVDDISVIVIPVYQYYAEYLNWEKQVRDRQSPVVTSGVIAENEETTGAIDIGEAAGDEDILVDNENENNKNLLNQEDATT